MIRLRTFISIIVAGAVTACAQVVPVAATEGATAEVSQINYLPATNAGEKVADEQKTQGMEAFTVAQVQGIPSRFLYFPEEGHWVQSPQNSVLWQRVFYDWLQRYCKDPKPAEPTPAKTDT